MTHEEVIFQLATKVHLSVLLLPKSFVAFSTFSTNFSVIVCGLTPPDFNSSVWLQREYSLCFGTLSEQKMRSDLEVEMNGGHCRMELE